MRKKYLALLAGLTLGIAVWILRRHETAADSVPRSPAAGSSQSLAAPNGAGNRPLDGAPTAADLPPGDAIDSVFAALGGALDEAGTKAQLDALAQRLRRAQGDESVKAIRDFLNQRRDASTRLPFVIDDGGNLATAPTFRVWLLDQLGRTNPEAAADYAQTILATRESADEWAVALRDYARARNAPADVTFLQSKIRELLTETRWQSEQSVGWLEAFDVAVHTRATELTPDLARLLTRTEKPDKAAAYAAYLTLDRLVQSAPVEMLKRLQVEPDLMTGRELTRANYFARADVRDLEQRALLESYLLDPSRTQAELAKFAGLFPNANQMISKNLLSPTATAKGGEIAAQDRAALMVVDEWTKDERFTKIRPHLNVIRQRLEEFVRQTRER